jgi:hypothetical protein
MKNIAILNKKTIEKYKKKVHKQYPGAFHREIKKGYFTICKVCEKKNDLKQLVENKKDALYINQLKYRLNKIGLEANNEFLDLCKLNAKLKRELCNNS